jgi:hypothetical protein
MVQYAPSILWGLSPRINAFHVSFPGFGQEKKHTVWLPSEKTAIRDLLHQRPCHGGMGMPGICEAFANGSSNW